MSYQWRHNAATGNYIANVTATMRLIRIGHADPTPDGITFLYRAEEWGDYSMRYPISGPWARTPSAAIADLARLAQVSA